MTWLLNIIHLGSFVLLLGIGIYFAFKEIQFFRTAILVPGIVVDIEEGLTRKGVRVYAPVVEFEFDGQIRRVQGVLGAPFKPKIGAKKTVGINPQHIYEARVKSNYNLIAYILLIILGLMGSVLGIILFSL